MNPAEYDYLRQFLKSRSGLVLSNEKQYLIESRLLPVARKAGLQSIAALVAKLKEPRETALAESVVEAMTTNESFFYRDKTPFEHFTQMMMPELLKSRASSKKIRIWCAAASTGQEPYTLAMCLKEMERQLVGWRIEILGTDISNEVLDRAKAGTYTQFEVQRGLPIQLLLKYFTQQGESWTIAPELRAMVQWRKFNLLDSFASFGQFDIVFCRNVLIYFDQATKVDILGRISKIMAPDGYLVLGAAETVVGLTDAFKPAPDRRGLYVPAAAIPQAAPRFSALAGAATRV
ncbi:chemotaxis protein CheR [Pleomorphomonas diazotrophica]|uniref:Chemotaxis protein methyltransferase n=1 Tax=Pleomorphomonas diazotrophica TaxID=1166257 RepID=A0A1I4W2Q1_9HYPH|nr:protein-glutamate O-methyltransferase CheR [Pleomorphomonas diazotrophica]PKR88208.1 chemotaxis protein CheR [Pleomorphomonas diazotrophica]SFN07359.1 chemotaxis protein methyltransferase CheR [Pleomorphomonas diazotrophica]